MAKLGKAQVDIRANLKPLRKGLAMAKKAVGAAMRGIAAVVKKAYAIAKKAALAFLAVTTASTFAALKQEEAEFTLASQLKLRGENVEELMKKYKAFANAMQRVTVFGDEETLMLLRQAAALGVNTDQLEEVVKAGMALAGMAGGRMKPRMAIKMLAEALGGSTAILAPYIKGLRNAKNETEEYIIINEALARGWDIVTAEAKTGFGALRQTKGIVWDIAEKFGAYFIPSIQNWREEMWKLKPTLEAWAATAGATTKFVKDVLIDSAKYVVTDFPNAWKAAKDMIVEIMTALAESIKVIFEDLWVHVGTNVGNWLKKGLAKRKEWKKVFVDTAEMLEKNYESTHGKWSARRDENVLDEINKSAKDYADRFIKAKELGGGFDSQFPTNKATGTMKKLEKIFNDLAGKLKDLIPPQYKDIYEKRLAELEVAKAEIAKNLKDALAAGDPSISPPNLRPEGGEGEDDKIKAKKGFGFVNAADAWRSFVMSMSPAEKKEIKLLTNIDMKLGELVEKNVIGRDGLNLI